MQTNAQRTSKLLSLFLLGAVLLAGVARADVPGFVKESLYSPNAAPVSEVIPSLAADVVILDGGLEQGIRLGMVCRVSRGFQEIGELIIIKSQSDRSAGLILELSEDSFIQAGDIARIKTLQNS
ncbi:hypothetical protein DDZ13_03015 [Coraliomargarita sinensis]|uniref:Flagellar assembly protein T C-terminal domain-containing protein n=1 Tax=Coraliomargarita sinensis TaxID=2174842 RepID=A0A317ZNI4_9BACT|nr:hypothetical protein [Coraliomargarita sinensis]PXA04951.1 hypothetical protein DDZ13_03015 [Coraliomargarita sinensis]